MVDMSRDDLQRLLEAEKDAQRTMALWKERAERAVMDARGDIQRVNEATLRSLGERSESELEQTRLAAAAAAEKTKAEGIEMARGLKERAHSKVPLAVERAIKALF